MTLEERIKGGILGVAVGDALGVPVEFVDREFLKENPVKDMKGWGSHNQPPGTWSDDTSLTLCTMVAFFGEFSLDTLGELFVEWFDNGYMTPHGEVFDVGRTTSCAILRIKNGVPPELAGLDGERDNGNGSLMRILPVSLYVAGKSLDEQMRMVHSVSAVTHAHPISLIACGIYTQIVVNILHGKEKEEAVKEGIETAIDYYSSREGFGKFLPLFKRIIDFSVLGAEEKNIKSSGFVLHTLEASLWCFINSDSFEEAVIKAVNLGGDTDTTGAVTGGLAGLYYGFSAIPKRWLRKLVKADLIERLSEKFALLLRKDIT